MLRKERMRYWGAVVLVVSACAAPALGCVRAPAAPSGAPVPAPSADSRYALSIAGDPDIYEPGQLYTVSLKGVESQGERKTFSGFTIWLEAEGVLNETISNRGSFHSYDTQSILDARCAGALVNSTDLTKPEIQVMWNAPLNGAGCVRLVASVGEAKNTVQNWSTLEYKICAAEPKLYGSQPSIIDPCCACDEAKYEVTFEGLWSRNTHPKDFPADERITRFSDVIGASHTVHYRFWDVGRVASQGLRELAEEGHTTTLEKELKAESDNIRTIIKARGMSWPRLGGATFAVFRVDARRHLVSLVSRLSPSPDWVVGVSALELCRANCTWLESDSIDLFPYDAGTDSGITYMSRRQRTIPAGPVRALRPDWPRDPRSPFFEPSGAAMKPFARMRLTRQRLYEKNCEQAAPPASSGSAGGAIMSAEREEWGACATGAWGPWSACSVTCGVGSALRQRYYLEPARAEAHSCRRPLSDRKKCRGPRMHCRAPSEYEPDPAASARGACAVSQWSEWSPCGARECEAGVQVRTRHYLHRSAYKRCHHGWRTKPRMDQTIDCYNTSDNCTHDEPETTAASSTGPATIDRTSDTNSTNGTWMYEDLFPVSSCPVSPWGSWSTCSARCGRGWRMRTRIYLIPAHPFPRNMSVQPRTPRRIARLQRRITVHLTNIWNRRFAAWQNIELPEYNHTDTDEELEEQLKHQLELCEFTLTMQDAECEGDDYTCQSDSHNATEVCGLPLAVGACRGYTERWFFEAQRRVCEPFGYTGCRGNRNNFLTRQQCLRVCGNFTGESNKKLKEATSKMKWIPGRMDSNNDVVQNDGTGDIGRKRQAVECAVGPWSGWSECMGGCAVAIKLNYRLVLRQPENGGRACPENLLKSRHCRPAECRARVIMLPPEE